MKSRIFRIGIGISIAILLIFSSGIIGAQQVKLVDRFNLMSNITNRIPNEIKESIPEFEDIYTREAPDWADGWYVGIWFDKDGEEYTLLGFQAGYYHKGNNAKRGFYAGVWNNTDNTTVGAMAGIHFRIFTFGRIHLSEEKKFPYSGFLLKNETHYFGRIMALVGDPVYMYGVHQPL